MRFKYRLSAALASPLAALAIMAPAAHAATTARPAVPLTTYCAAGELQVGWFDTNDDAVASWSASKNYFLENQSGHTIFCQKNKKLVNGVPYWEYAAVLNGRETNDCVSLKNGASKPVGLNGCSAGTNYLLWADILNCAGVNSPPECIAALYTGDWIIFAGAFGQPLQVATPEATDFVWWKVAPG